MGGACGSRQETVSTHMHELKAQGCCLAGSPSFSCEATWIMVLI